MQLYVLEVDHPGGRILFGPLVEEAIEVHLERLGYSKEEDSGGWRCSPQQPDKPVRLREIHPSIELADESPFD